MQNENCAYSPCVNQRDSLQQISSFCREKTHKSGRAESDITKQWTANKRNTLCTHFTCQSINEDEFLQHLLQDVTEPLNSSLDCPNNSCCCLFCSWQYLPIPELIRESKYEISGTRDFYIFNTLHRGYMIKINVKGP